MKCTARRSASIGSQRACWRGEQSPRLTWCLARSAVALDLLRDSAAMQPAARSRRSEAGGEGSALERRQSASASLLLGCMLTQEPQTFLCELPRRICAHQGFGAQHATQMRPIGG